MNRIHPLAAGALAVGVLILGCGSSGGGTSHVNPTSKGDVNQLADSLT